MNEDEYESQDPEWADDLEERAEAIDSVFRAEVYGPVLAVDLERKDDVPGWVVTADTDNAEFFPADVVLSLRRVASDMGLELTYKNSLATRKVGEEVERPCSTFWVRRG